MRITVAPRGVCEECPMQTYQGGEEKQTCEVCPENTFTKAKGSIQCEEPTQDTDKLHTPLDSKIVFNPVTEALELSWTYDTSEENWKMCDRTCGQIVQTADGPKLDVEIESDTTCYGQPTDKVVREKCKEASAFDVRISNDRQFSDDTVVQLPRLKSGNARNMTLVFRVDRVQAANGDGIFGQQIPPYHVRLPTYVQVRAAIVDGSKQIAGAWSVSTDPWVRASQCDDEGYLSIGNTEPSEWKCRPCPLGASCLGNTVWADVRNLQGYWRIPWATDPDETFERCPYEGDCIGFDVAAHEQLIKERANTAKADKIANSNSSSSQTKARRLSTRPGHLSGSHRMLAETTNTSQPNKDGCKLGTEGVLCSQCSENYNRDASVCTKCSDSSLPVRLSLFLAVVGLIVTIMAVFQKRLKKKWRRFAPLYRDVLRIFSIMVTFQQISTSVSLVIEVPWPRNFVAFMSYFKVVNIDVFAIIGVSCVGNFNFMMSFIGMCCLPVSILVFTWLRVRMQRRAMSQRVAKMDDMLRAQVEQESLHQLFHIVDTDGGGSITPREFKVLLQELNCNIDAEHARKVIEALVNTDGTGLTHLYENDFVKNMLNGKLVDALKRLGSIDLDKDTLLADKAWLVKWTLFKKLWANALAGATMLLMLAHTPVSRKVFQYFHCNNLAGKEYLFADYTVRCYSTSWWAFLPLVLVVLFCFTILLPGSISLYLYKERHHLYTAKVQQKVGWLYQAYKRGAEFWQVHDVILKMILTGMVCSLLVFTPHT